MQVERVRLTLTGCFTFDLLLERNVFLLCVFRHVQYLPDEEQAYDPHWWVTWLYVHI